VCGFLDLLFFQAFHFLGGLTAQRISGTCWAEASYALPAKDPGFKSHAWTTTFSGWVSFFLFFIFLFRLCSLCNSVIVSRDGFLLFPLPGCLCGAKIGCAIQCCGCHPRHVQGLGTQICTLSAIVRHKVSGVPSCISRNRFLISKRAVRKSLLQADTLGAY